MPHSFSQSLLLMIDLSIWIAKDLSFLTDKCHLSVSPFFSSTIFTHKHKKIYNNYLVYYKLLYQGKLKNNLNYIEFALSGR